MKDEVRGNIINEFVGLKSKMYSLVMVDDEEIKKTKDSNKILLKATEDIKNMMICCLVGYI